MGMRIKAAVLLCLLSASAYSVCGAYRSIHRHADAALPEELSARFESDTEAEYYLRDSGGYIAVFESRRAREPLSVTAIETGVLRDTDRLLLSRGIPVQDLSELLELLEDLGS